MPKDFTHNQIADLFELKPIDAELEKSSQELSFWNNLKNKYFRFVAPDPTEVSSAKAEYVKLFNDLKGQFKDVPSHCILAAMSGDAEFIQGEDLTEEIQRDLNTFMGHYHHADLSATYEYVMQALEMTKAESRAIEALSDYSHKAIAELIDGFPVCQQLEQASWGASFWNNLTQKYFYFVRSFPESTDEAEEKFRSLYIKYQGLFPERASTEYNLAALSADRSYSQELPDDDIRQFIYEFIVLYKDVTFSKFLNAASKSKVFKIACNEGILRAAKHLLDDSDITSKIKEEGIEEASHNCNLPILALLQEKNTSDRKRLFEKYEEIKKNCETPLVLVSFTSEQKGKYLTFCSYWGMQAQLEILLDLHVKDVKQEDINTAFLYAATNHYWAVSYFLEKIGKSLREPIWKEALRLACESNKDAIVYELLEYNQKMNNIAGLDSAYINELRAVYTKKKDCCDEIIVSLKACAEYLESDTSNIKTGVYFGYDNYKNQMIPNETISTGHKRAYSI